MNRIRSARRKASLCLVGLLVLAGCSTSDRIEKNPVGIVRDKSQSPQLRVMAVDYIAQQRTAPGAARINPQAAYKEIAWSGGEPAQVRAAVIHALLNDPDPAVVQDAREMAKLLLAKEPSREVVVVICEAASRNGWTDFVPALVRSYSRPVEGMQEADRAERKALEKLGGGKPVEEIAFEVFLNPPKMESTKTVDWTMRYRADAWDLLARLDKDGAFRERMLAAAEAGSVQSDPLLLAIAACRRDLRAIPTTGDELVWLLSLRDPEKKDNVAWWQEATAAVARTNAPPGSLRLRHAEPIRWCATARPQWLQTGREELLSMLATKMDGRKNHRRSVNDGPSSGPSFSELLEKRRQELGWGDVLAILVIDEAIREPQITTTFFSQAKADRADTTTEYGGLIAWRKGTGGEHAVAVLYPPRPVQRRGDDRFIASDDMVSAGDLSLAHYHYHVQRERNADYAGPSAGDLIYAARHGRSCVVLTSVSATVLAADWYGPEGVVIDLGEIAAR